LLLVVILPHQLGAILIDLADVKLAAMVVLAFVFGAILGTGLPPAPTYILVAIVIAPPMIRVGVNPWVVHFFAFFLGVWGELTPPTSLVGAVAGMDANPLRTMPRPSKPNAIARRPDCVAEDAVGSELVSTEFSGITGQNTGENRKTGAKIATISSTGADSIRVSSEIPREK